MGHAEYQKAYRCLKECCAKHGEQRAWFSTAVKKTDDKRHKRLPYTPQDTLLRDLTEAQRIGYDLLSPCTLAVCTLHVVHVVIGQPECLTTGHFKHSESSCLSSVSFLQMPSGKACAEWWRRPIPVV
jgi:hypothetical protein